VTAIALALSVAQFLPLYTGPYSEDVAFLAVHVGATVAIAFLIVGAAGRRAEDARVPLHDALMAASAIACAAYFVSQGYRISRRIPAVDSVEFLDIVFGILLILLLLEACRRIAGIVLTLVGILLIAFIFLGPHLPAFLSHRGLTLERFIDLQVLSTSGMFGSPISASARMVFYFLVVGAFLERSGAGKLFVNIAYAFTARMWGGAGKAAVVASGLFGVVSGSAVANVLLSGIMTIPLMKRSGFRPSMAGAIEATASTGGQLAPPIMGAAAFILADVIGRPYAEVVIAAAVPAVLYYLSLIALIHAHALRNGLKPDYSTPLRAHFSGLRQRWHLLLPLVLMIVLLMNRHSLMYVGAWTTVAVIATSAVRQVTRLGPRDMLAALVSACKAACEVAIPSAVAGIIVGTLVHTGMALRLQRFMLELADGSLLLSLVGAMVLTLILGMGMPTAAAYLVSAILVAPALIELGVPALPAHLFIFYFAILSMVTPPVALSAYAAAGISGSNLWDTGVRAFLLAVPGFVIPYAFVFNPALILQGSATEALAVIGPAALGVVGMAAAAGGWLLGPLPLPMRVLLFCSGPLLIAPGLYTDAIGFAAMGLMLGIQVLRRVRAADAAEGREAHANED
jgi:TRAP transporter 4TM/12TM fusion protein